MSHHLRTLYVSGTLLAAAVWLASSSHGTGTVARVASDPWGRYRSSSPCFVLSGTTINVALGSNISSQTARVGDAWHGTVTEYVMTQNENVIPPGSVVDGVVTGVTPSEYGSHAILELSILSIRVDGHDEAIAGTTESVIAGSSHARRLGAVSEGAGAVLPDATVMSFTVGQTVAMSQE